MTDPRRICSRCPRVAREGSRFCSRCGDEWRTPEYRRVRLWILEHAPMWCVLCMEGPREDDPWTIEHIVPRRLGGGHEWTNLGRAHRSCNSAGGGRSRRGSRAKRKARSREPRWDNTGRTQLAPESTLGESKLSTLPRAEEHAPSGTPAPARARAAQAPGESKLSAPAPAQAAPPPPADPPALPLTRPLLKALGNTHSQAAAPREGR